MNVTHLLSSTISLRPLVQEPWSQTHVQVKKLTFDHEALKHLQ